MLGKIATALIVLLGIETIFLAMLLSQPPEVKFQPTDHFICDMSGNPDHDHGPVSVQFIVGRHNKQVVILKTELESWKQAEAICDSWTHIGYKLEK